MKILQFDFKTIWFLHETMKVLVENYVASC